MCGIVSFKRGDAFFRANKVIVKKDNPDVCEAVVTGSEDFHVTIENDESGSIRTICSCPKLASFQKDCQHIAAVLLLIYEHQRQGIIPSRPSEDHTNPSTSQVLTEGLMTLFNDQPVRSSGHQLHFEKRKVLDVEFTCKPITIGKGRQMFGIEM